MKSCEDYHPLIAGLLDEELTPEEAQEINQHLSRCEKCRKEFEQLREISGKLSFPSFKEPTDEVLETLWKSPYSRFTRNAGVVMVFLGYLLLTFYGIYEFFIDENEALIPKVGVAALVFGFVILVAGLARERLKTYRNDPYKEIER